MKSLLCSLLGALLLLTSCQVSVLGGEDLRDSIKPTDPMWLGCAASSVAVHELSHIAVMEDRNVPYKWEWDGSFSYTAESLSDKEAISRAGFVGQLGGSYLLKSINAKKVCQDGYNWGTTMQIATYMLRRNGHDLKYLSDREYATYLGTAISLNILDIKW